MVTLCNHDIMIFVGMNGKLLQKCTEFHLEGEKDEKLNFSHHNTILNG